MFTGIIETLGEVTAIDSQGTNLVFTITSSISSELKIDQSLSHDGVCLTVVEVNDDSHKVVAIKESLDRSAIGGWEVGSKVNLERAMQMGGRLDGHIVQGHVDTIATCSNVEQEDGSWKFTFTLAGEHQGLMVDKGSVTINGVSLTVVSPQDDEFSVAIIPYTYEHTNFNTIREGSKVNIEFDILGKYVKAHMESMTPA